MTAMKLFINGILLMGLIRFVMTASGVENSISRYASMSAIITVGAIYFALVCSNWKERLKAAYLLMLIHNPAYN